MTEDLRGRRVLVTGAAGQLGRYLRAELVEVGAEVVGLGSRPSPGVDLVVDITDEGTVARAVESASPAIVVHAAAYTDVDGAEREPERAEAVNADGSRNVARATNAIGAYLVAIGTDFVFAGDGGAPYAEDAAPNPVSVYGRTKLLAEQAVIDENPGFAVARTAWLYGGAGKHFPRTVLSVLRDRGGIDVVADEFGSPTFAGDLARAVVKLAALKPAGIYHLANSGRASRFELAQAVAGLAGFSPELVRPTTTAEFLAKYPLPAQRPADSTLLNTRAEELGVELPTWDDAARRYVPKLAAEFRKSRLEGKG